MRRRWLEFRRPLGLILVLILGTMLTAAGDWPTYLHDPQHSGDNQNETILSSANASQIVKLWSFKAGLGIVASPTVANGIVYVGAKDGYEYALDAVTGVLKWKTFLGITLNSISGCPTIMGVSSSATVQNGTLYVGGGNSYWYALNATTGAILWKVNVGSNSATSGHYNWSSPLVYKAYAYVGVASLCDTPLVQGQLFQINLLTHHIVRSFNVVPTGQVGGSIWASPSIDTATNTVYIVTGNEGQEPPTSQPYSLAMIALDATTLAVKGFWQIPASQGGFDSDWGTTPVIFNDENGQPLVAATNKNGIVYAFNRNNISAGPVWEQTIAISGDSPEKGQGSVSSGAFGGGVLFKAGGITMINSTPYSGSVRALDPATGNIVWEHGGPGYVLSALAYANGLVIDGSGWTLEILDASTGNLLFSYRASNFILGVSVANGRIYASSADDNLYAFGLPNQPATPTSTPTAVRG